jgi:hypothetical protein
MNIELACATDIERSPAGEAILENDFMTDVAVMIIIFKPRPCAGAGPKRIMQPVVAVIMSRTLRFRLETDDILMGLVAQQEIVCERVGG